MWDRFTIAGSGDMVGTYKDYFKDGELTGTFDLQPLDSGSTSTSFYSSPSRARCSSRVAPPSTGES